MWAKNSLEKKPTMDDKNRVNGGTLGGERAGVNTKHYKGEGGRVKVIRGGELVGERFRENDHSSWKLVEKGFSRRDHDGSLKGKRRAEREIGR